jgi:hypothetical protein
VLEKFRRELLGVDWGRTAEAVEAFIAEKVDGAGVGGLCWVSAAGLTHLLWRPCAYGPFHLIGFWAL